MAVLSSFVSIALAFAFVLLNVSVCTCVTVTTSPGKRVLNPTESENVYKALQNMVDNVNRNVQLERDYYAGRLFTEVINPDDIRSATEKRVLIRHTRWSSECSISMAGSDMSKGRELLDALKPLLPIIRPYVLMGKEWLSISNHTDFIDYYVLKTPSNAEKESPSHKILSEGPGSSVTDCAIKPTMLLSDSAFNQLLPGDSLLSPDGKYKLTIPGPPLIGAPCVLIMEDKEGHVVWQTHSSAPQLNCYLAFQSDGTLELWNNNNRIWYVGKPCSEIKCAGSESLAVKDGEIKLYRSVDDHLSLYSTVPTN